MKNTNKKVYVTMTDKFLSGWGMAQGKTNKLVIGTNSYNEAEIIAKNAKLRSDMKYVNITSKKPYYNKKRVLVSERDYSELGDLWKK